MNYLPTTSLDVNPLFYVAIVIGVTLVIGLGVLAVMSNTAAKEAVQDSTNQSVKPKYKKRNILAGLMILSFALTFVPAVGVAKAYEEIDEQAKQNLFANLESKYDIESLRTQAFKTKVKTYLVNLSPRYEGTQVVSVQKDGKFNLYFMTQDKETHEPFLYEETPQKDSEPLTELPD